MHKTAFWALQDIEFLNRVDLPRINAHFSEINLEKKKGLNNTFLHSMARAHLNKSKFFLTSTTAASKYTQEAQNLHQLKSPLSDPNLLKSPFSFGTQLWNPHSFKIIIIFSIIHQLKSKRSQLMYY
jgi:hypothetical protein